MEVRRRSVPEVYHEAAMGMKC